MRALAALALAASTLALPAAAAKVSDVSWGKAGVSFATYRADSIACARQGYYLDVADTEAARTLIDASRKIETITETGAPDSGNQQIDINPSSGAAMGSGLDPSYNPAILRSIEQSQRIGRTVAAARPDKQMRAVGALQKSTLEQCLAARGYTRFRLTRNQLRHVRKLRAGSPERHDYLYGLATNPEVLRDQAIG